MSELSSDKLAEIREIIKTIEPEEVIQFSVNDITFEIAHHNYDDGPELIEYMREGINYPYQSVNVTDRSLSEDDINEILAYIEENS